MSVSESIWWIDHALAIYDSNTRGDRSSRFSPDLSCPSLFLRSCLMCTSARGGKRCGARSRIPLPFLACCLRCRRALTSCSHSR